MKKIRYALVNFILNDNEKYLLSSALDSRVDALRKYSVEEKTADHYNTKEDIAVLLGMYYKIQFNNK